MLPSALEAGARGFVSKSDIGSNLLSVIESIVQRASPPSDPERQRAESLLLEQNQLLELIARGRPLDDCLRAITESVSRLQPGVRAAVALCDCSGARLAQVVSSRLPVELTAQLCELPIGSHIAGDALWSPQLRELCIAHGVRAVHTSPVCNGEGTALASFIVCLEEAREPNAWERDLVQFGAHLGSLAIERKQAEDMLRQRSAQLETLVDQAPIGVFLLDGELRVRRVNPVARPAFGPIPDLVGRDYCELLHQAREPDYAAEVLRIFRHTLATGESHHATEQVRSRGGGASNECYEWHVERIPLPEGGHGVVCYFRNVSVELQARAALQETRDHLERRVQERTEQLEKAYKSLRVLSMRMFQMQDEDRRRIARVLHDSAG